MFLAIYMRKLENQASAKNTSRSITIGPIYFLRNFLEAIVAVLTISPKSIYIKCVP